MAKFSVVLAIALVVVWAAPVGALPTEEVPETIRVTEGTTDFGVFAGGLGAANPKLGFTVGIGMLNGADTFVTLIHPGEIREISIAASGSDMRASAYFDGELYFYSELQAGCCEHGGDGTAVFSATFTGPPAAPPGTVVTVTGPFTLQAALSPDFAPTLFVFGHGEQDLILTAYALGDSGQIIWQSQGGTGRFCAHKAGPGRRLGHQGRGCAKG